MVGTVTGVEYRAPRVDGAADRFRHGGVRMSSWRVGLLSGVGRTYLLGLGSQRRRLTAGVGQQASSDTRRGIG